MNSDDYKSIMYHPPVTDHTTLANANWVITIDISGSTVTKIKTGKTVLDTEIEFAKNIIRKIDPTHNSISVIQWDTKASMIQSSQLETLKSSGGTEPVCIFRNENCYDAIKKADALMIITDGCIDQNEVSAFGKTMTSKGCHLKAVVGVLVGDRHIRLDKQDNGTQERTLNKYTLTFDPANIDVSVLVPAMISDACILYHDGIDTFVMWSNGSFRQTWNPTNIDMTTSWSDLTTVDVLYDSTDSTDSTNITNITNIKCKVCDPNQVLILTEKGYIPIGDGRFINPVNLLKSTPTFETLSDLPFNWICQYFRVTDKYNELYEWFKQQKTRLINESINELVFKNANHVSFDIDFEHLVEKINNLHPSERRDHLQPPMLSYINERTKHICQHYIDSNEGVEHDILNASGMLSIEKRIIFFREMIKIMNDDIKLIELANDNQVSYTCSSLSMSRYSTTASSGSLLKKTSTNQSTLPQVISDLPPKVNLVSTLTATFDEPYAWERQLSRLYPDTEFIKRECSICCAKSIPFIWVSLPINIRNLNDNNPSEHFCSPIVCSKCSDFFCCKTKHYKGSEDSCMIALPLIQVNYLTPYDRLNYIKAFSANIKDTNVSYGMFSSIIHAITSFSNISNQTPSADSNDLIIFAKFVKTHTDNNCDNYEIIDIYLKSLTKIADNDC